MEHRRISIIVSALLLCLLSACQMTGVTPQPPGAGIVQNNPGGLIQAPPTSTTPTAAPTASSGCNQLGCPYPAVCDKTSGVCTINQAQGPAAAPQAPGAGIHREQSRCQFAGPGLPATAFNHQQNYILLRQSIGESGRGDHCLVR